MISHQRMPIVAACFTIALSVGTSAFAATATTGSTAAVSQIPAGGIPVGMASKTLSDIVTNCIDTAKKDKQGMPEQASIDACMTAKGFPPPPPPPGMAPIPKVPTTVAPTAPAQTK